MGIPKPCHLDEKHPVPHEVYSCANNPDRRHVVTHKSKWTIWYQDWYGTKVMFQRMTSRIQWELDEERGEIVRAKAIYTAGLEEEKLHGPAPSE